MNVEKKRGHDFLLYVMIAVALVGIIAASAAYTASHHLNKDRVMKWEGFAFMTLVLLGCLVRSHWFHRKTGRFWFSLLCLLLAHLGTGMLLLSQFQRVKWVIFLVIFLPELQLMNALMRNVLRTAPSHPVTHYGYERGKTK